MVAWPLACPAKDNNAIITGMQVSFLIDIENLKPDRVLSGSNPCPVLHGRQRCYFSTFYQRIPRDRKRVVYGKSVSVRVDLGGRSIIKKKNIQKSRIDY